MSKYANFDELARHERAGKDYRVRLRPRPQARVLIAAPHGGMIEIGTSEVARLIAGDDHSLFIFEGLKPYGANRDLHITSHCFDHPECLAMAARCETVVSVHGCVGEHAIHLGGLDWELGGRIADCLGARGFAVERRSERYPGLHPRNICNLGARRRGVQIEMTYDLRTGPYPVAIASAVRAVLSAAPGAASTSGEDDAPAPPQ